MNEYWIKSWKNAMSKMHIQSNETAMFKRTIDFFVRVFFFFLNRDNISQFYIYV